jgi:hypothetical protein
MRALIPQTKHGSGGCTAAELKRLPLNPTPHWRLMHGGWRSSSMRRKPDVYISSLCQVYLQAWLTGQVSAQAEGWAPHEGRCQITWHSPIPLHTPPLRKGRQQRLNKPSPLLSHPAGWLYTADVPQSLPIPSALLMSSKSCKRGSLRSIVDGNAVESDCQHRQPPSKTGVQQSVITCSST